MDDTGICYTWSGNKKKYEPNKFSISPNKVKLVDFDNLSCEPFIPYTFTSSNKPPEVSLEDGTAMYSPELRNLDPDIDLSTYLTYTPPDGYELVSEDHQYDTGVKKYYVSEYFYVEPFTVYYGTAGKTFNDLGLGVGKYFYYKKKPIPNDYKIYYVTLTLNNNTLNCSCGRITSIPGTNNGDFTLGIIIQFGDGVGTERRFEFEWKMKNGINENRYCNVPYYMGSGFTTQNIWDSTRSDGSKVYFDFEIDHSSIPDLYHTINETSTEEISSDDKT